MKYKDFREYCNMLDGKIVKLKVDKDGILETAVCRFEGKKLDFIPTGYEHDEASLDIDGKRVDFSYDQAYIGMTIDEKFTKDIKEVFVSANINSSVEFKQKHIFEWDAVNEIIKIVW